MLNGFLAIVGCHDAAKRLYSVVAHLIIHFINDYESPSAFDLVWRKLGAIGGYFLSNDILIFTGPYSC